MTHADVVAALAALYPGVEWSYDGNGDTLDPVPGISYGLIWSGPDPAPTMADIEAAQSSVQAASAPPETTATAAPTDKVAAALAVIESSALDDATRAVLSQVVEALG